MRPSKRPSVDTAAIESAGCGGTDKRRRILDPPCSEPPKSAGHSAAPVRADVSPPDRADLVVCHVQHGTLGRTRHSDPPQASKNGLASHWRHGSTLEVSATRGNGPAAGGEGRCSILVAVETVGQGWRRAADAGHAYGRARGAGAASTCRYEKSAPRRFSVPGGITARRQLGSPLNARRRTFESASVRYSSRVSRRRILPLDVLATAPRRRQNYRIGGYAVCKGDTAATASAAAAGSSTCPGVTSWTTTSHPRRRGRQ